MLDRVPDNIDSGFEFLVGRDEAFGEGGKLVGALAVSPTVLAAYREKYTRPSEIASAMAGRPILREARLAFVGTTSLYGTGSSQYNRLFWPSEVMGREAGVRMGFYELGRSRSFGT